MNSYKQAFNIILTLFLLLLSPLSAQKKFVIVLDAGHGGKDIGANRKYDQTGWVQEKEVTLQIVLKLGRMLEKNKDFKVIYTRKVDEFPSLVDRTDLANRSHADLFVSIHCNASVKPAPYGTETYVQGPDQNKTNLEVAKRENDVIYLDAKDREMFASYDPTSPESLIALKFQQSKYLESSLIFGGFVEENFAKKDKRFSRGVMQKNLHVLRLNAMPSVLIETGFISNPEEAAYLASEKGQEEVAESVYEAILMYKKKTDRYQKKVEAPKEQPLKNDFRILLMSSPMKYAENDPAMRGLNYILTIKENGLYKYYYSITNFASIRDNNLKTAKDAGFRNASAVSFIPNQAMNTGYYRIELYTGKDKLPKSSPILTEMKDVAKTKTDGTVYYTYGEVYSLEAAIKLQKEIEKKGIENTVIEKVYK